MCLSRLYPRSVSPLFAKTLLPNFQQSAVHVFAFLSSTIVFAGCDSGFPPLIKIDAQATLDARPDAHCDGTTDNDRHSSCNVESCLDGCCTAQEQCVSGDTDTACGKNGTACVDCSAMGKKCQGGQCIDHECTQGPCCENGRFLPAGTVCDTIDASTQYRCDPIMQCGSAMQTRQRVSVCTGDNGQCNPTAREWTDWTTVGFCGPDGACDWDGQGAYCTIGGEDLLADCIDSDCDGVDYSHPQVTTMEFLPAEPTLLDDAIEIQNCSDTAWSLLALVIMLPSGEQVVLQQNIESNCDGFTWGWSWTFYPTVSGQYRFTFWQGFPPSEHGGVPLICREVYVSEQ
jgi:hypothetical protein